MLQTSTPRQSELFRSTLTNLVQLGKVGPGFRVSLNPLPIYVVGLSDLRDQSTALSKALLVGWRFFAGNRAGEVVAADISADQPPRVMGILCDDCAIRAFLSTKEIESNDRVKDGYHDLRLLRISGALVSALWMKPTVAGGDGFCVVQDADFMVEKQPKSHYEMSDFLSKLWSSVGTYKGDKDRDRLVDEPHPLRSSVKG